MKIKATIVFEIAGKPNPIEIGEDLETLKDELNDVVIQYYEVKEIKFEQVKR